MRMRGIAAAAAGVVGAAGAHALDVAGQLPAVHESVAVRGAMGPAATGCWLLLAAALAWLAALTRPALVGPAGALLVSGVPELVGRRDPGAVAEPGAIAGALVQCLLVLAVVAVAMVLERRLGEQPLVVMRFVTRWIVRPPALRRGVSATVLDETRPRGPPTALWSHVHSNQRGRTWPYLCAAASWRLRS